MKRKLLANLLAISLSLFSQGCLVSSEPLANNSRTRNFLSLKENLSYVLTQTERGPLKVCHWKSHSSNDSVIYLNGLVSHGLWFSEVAKNLSEKGIETHALDRRGTGINLSLYGSSNDWFDDISKLSGKIAAENKNIHLVSLCFGARLATAYAAQHNSEISSLIYISPGLKTKVQPSLLEQLVILSSGIWNNSNILISSPVKNPRLFSFKKDVISYIENDTLKVTFPRAIDIYSGFELSQNLKLEKITSPVLVLFAEHDPISNNYENYKLFCNFGSDEIVFKRYKGCRHALPLENPARVANDISDWVNSH